MPIVVEHQPPFQAAGGVSYDTGWNQGIAQRRQELWQRQMQMAQLAQAQQAQQMNLWSQQQAQRSANERLVLGAYLDQQGQASQNAARMQAYQQELSGHKELASQQNDFQVQRDVRTADQQILNQSHEVRGEVEQILGGIDESNLQPRGAALYHEVQNDLAELEKAMPTSKPSDYYYGLREIAGKAAGLRLPGMVIKPPATPEEQFKSSVYDDPVSKRRYLPDGKGGWKDIGRSGEQAHAVGDEYSTPQGSRVTQLEDGKVQVIFNAPEAKAKLRKQILDEMNAEVKAAGGSGSSGTAQIPGAPGASPAIPGAPGAAPGALGAPPPNPKLKPWMNNPDEWRKEYQSRYDTQWLDMSGEAQAVEPNIDQETAAMLKAANIKPDYGMLEQGFSVRVHRAMGPDGNVVVTGVTYDKRAPAQAAGAPPAPEGWRVPMRMPEQGQPAPGTAPAPAPGAPAPSAPPGPQAPAPSAPTVPRSTPAQRAIQRMEEWGHNPVGPMPDWNKVLDEEIAAGRTAQSQPPQPAGQRAELSPEVMQAWLREAPSLIKTWMIRSPGLQGSPIMVKGQEVLSRRPQTWSEDDIDVLWNVYIQMQAAGMPVPQ